MVSLRSLLEKRAGKNIVIALAITAILIAAYVIKNAIFSSEVSQERDRIFIDSTTLKPFSHELERGESIPVVAPSGGKTGYPGELCYWNRDGTVKSDPTVVLLNSWIGKPGPTFCPDCGRLVVENNPPAVAGRRPPPTREEYLKRYGASNGELLHPVASGN